MKAKQLWLCMGIGLLAWAGGMVVRGDDAAKNGSSAMNPSEAVDPLAVHEEKNGLRILLLGNSITLHEYYPSIGWTNEWGMAASAIEKDYAHLFIREIERKTGRRADWRIRNIATFERSFETYDCAKKFAAEYAYRPDIVVLAVGENMRNIKDDADERLLGDRIQTLLRPFAEQAKKPIILVRGVFWPNDRKDAGLKMAADACGAKWVPTCDLGKEDENLALGKFAHAGVAHHPGDLGMARIAQRLAAAAEDVWLATKPVAGEFNTGLKVVAGPGKTSGRPTVKAVDFGFAETNENCGAAINRALEQCRKVKASRLELAPGSYRCFGEGVKMTGLQDVTLDGRGAELRFRPGGDAVSVRVADCARVAVKNIVFVRSGMGEGVNVERAKGVLVEGCRFVEPVFLVGRVKSGSDVVFRGNDVWCDATEYGTREWKGAFAIEDVPNVVVENNRYRVRKDRPEPVVEYFQGQAARTAVRGNRMERYGATSVESLWEVFGSVGRADGEAEATAEGGWRFKGAGYVLETRKERDGEVTLTRSKVRNVSGRSMTFHCLMDRFPLEEGDWEAYTQVSFWENESRGRWQDLHTAVEVRNPNMRSSNGVAPVLAVWNRQTGRGRVFHLLSNSAYEMHAVRSNSGGNKSSVAVEVGMDGRQLAYELAPGEEVAFPEVLSYEFENRLDLDCHKLHAWWNRHFPGRPPAAIYNTWLCRFDKLDADFLLRQVACAKKLGMEYFVIDAGWFGPAADWGSVRGQWEEFPNGYLKGRMSEVSAAARAAGMKFGFWVEAESVMGTARVAKEHPEWLLPHSRAFLDFTNPEAFKYIVETVCALLKKYDASFLKFDYNQNLGHDPTGCAFTRYNSAYRAFVREIRRRNPGIYIEGCASGGYMMDLGWARDFDGFWLSDNQSPHHGLRIVKESMLRMPPRQIERWIVARTITGVQPDYGGRDARLFATDDATWTNGRTYFPEYIDAFAAGGPFCFSCDLTALSSEHTRHFAEVVAARKADGAFWHKAVGRILHDSPNLVAFQYSDEALTDIRVIAVAEVVHQYSLRVYPALDPAATYVVNGETRSGADIRRTGLVVGIDSHRVGTVTLKRK